MRGLESRTVWGGLLILLGVLLLLQTMGFLRAGLSFLWAAVFALFGLGFLYLYASERARAWWAIIPALTLLGLALVTFVGAIDVPGSNEWAGALFLAMIGLSFWIVYFQNREFWWAIIPGGTLFSVALVAGLSDVFGGSDLGGAILFFGLAATFGIVSVVPTPKGRMRWALIPAAVLFVLGIVVLSSLTPLAGYLWPLVLIVAGLYLLLRSRGSRPQGSA